MLTLDIANSMPKQHVVTKAETALAESKFSYCV